MYNVNESQSGTISGHLVEVMDFHGSHITFEEIDGRIMINATEMAKPFGKRTRDWLLTQQSQDLLHTVSKARNLPLGNLKVVRKGGSNPGTWFQKDVALFFAQWLSPEFYLACNQKLEELLVKNSSLFLTTVKYGIKAIIYEGRILYPYTQAVRSMGNVKRPNPSRRKKAHPEHFVKVMGRNFITARYLDVLHGYYSYKKAIQQMKAAQLNLGI